VTGELRRITLEHNSGLRSAAPDPTTYTEYINLHNIKNAVSSSAIPFTLIMEAQRSSKMSVLTKAILRNIPEILYTN
jgi:hypothetical protein